MIIGHEKQFDYLKRIYLSNNLPHALLFSGSDRIGKRKVAIEFAKFINCAEKNLRERPCGVCRNCVSIDNNQFPDVIWISPQRVSSKGILRKEIKIIQIRKLKKKISLKRYQSPLRIVIIDEAHYLNQESQGALLKVLEEPRGDTLFVLITSFPNLLLPTIRSRTEEIKFYPPSEKEVYDFLIRKGLSKDKVDMLYFFSSGKIGEIIELLNNPEELEKRKDLIKKINSISSMLLVDRFSFADRVITEEKIREFLKTMTIYLRATLLLDVMFGSGKKLTIGEIKIYPSHSFKKIVMLLDQAQKIYQLISFTNVNPRIALRVLLMNF